MNKKDFGDWGEKVACWYLKNKGYKIVLTHFTSRFGEIDVIAQKDGQTIFVEVKTRKTEAYGAPEQSVNFNKLSKIRKAALEYSSKNNIESGRIDVISIIKDDLSDIAKIRHHKSIEPLV